MAVKPIQIGNHDALANFLKQKIKECKSEEDASEYRQFLKFVIKDKGKSQADEA